MRKLFCRTFLVYLSTDAHDVSVCRDATYFIPDHRGNICAGSGSQPSGKECPIKGDIAVESCRMEMVTFLKESKTCVAKENAVCDIVRGSTWGCIFPSVGCKPTDIVAECPAWTLRGTDWINPNFSKPIQEQPQVIPEELTQQKWFTQETPVSDLTSECEIIRIPAMTPRPMKRIPSIQTGDNDPTLISTMSSSNEKSQSAATTIVAIVAIAATVVAAAAGIAALVRYRLVRKPALETGYRMDLVLTPR